MIQYEIIQNEMSHRPSISFDGVYSIMNEINSCDYEHPREKAVYDLLKTI